LHDLLLGTSKALIFIYNDIPYYIFKDNKIYYGITWDEEYLYIAERLKSTITVIKKDGSIQYMTFPFMLLELHGLYYYNGILYAVETGKNSIIYIDNNYYIAKRFVHNNTIKPDNHINTIWSDENFIYVLEHNNTEKTGILSRVVKYDYDFNVIEEIDNMGVASHNVFIHNNYMYVCSSMGEGIIKMNMKTREKEFIDTSKYCTGLTRGIAFVDDRIYVGISKFSNRKERHLGGNAVILIFDNEWNYIDQLNLGDVGQLLEIRAVSGIDKCHNGIPFPKTLKEMIINKINNSRQFDGRTEDCRPPH